MKNLFPILLIILILCSWQYTENAINQTKISNGETSLEAIIPTPLNILKTFQKDGSLIFKEVLFTLEKAAIGFLFGAAFAVLVAIFFSFFPSIRNLFFPLAFAINSFPIVGLAPAIILAFGQGSFSSIVFISALICYFPILISMDTAFKETEKDFVQLMRIMNASKIQTLLKVKLPLSLPYFLLSLKLAIPASIIGATMGEWLGSRTGIGQLITISLYQLKPGLLYASLITITLVSLISVLIILGLEKLLLPWKNK